MIDFKNLEVPYFIAEIGINHNGDIKIVKKLIDAAFACNWDCVKFQKRNPDVCVPDILKNNIRKTPWGEITYLEYRKKVEFGKREYNYIDKYARDKPIDWSTSVWDLDSLEFILPYELPFIKIPSAMLTNDELLKETSKINTTIILSTGMSEIKEIDHAVNIIKKYNKNDLVLMHCNSSYPTPIEELNLNIIPFLKKRYNCIIGYSGHESDLEPTVVAVVMGAKVIERHITLSHDMWGTDQKSSLEVVGMDMLRKRVKDVSVMLGDGVKRVTKSEEEIKNKLRKLNSKE
jgi:N-acetylneuraminate synthase